jgi:hypothetical protein
MILRGAHLRGTKAPPEERWQAVGMSGEAESSESEPVRLRVAIVEFYGGWR